MTILTTRASEQGRITSLATLVIALRQGEGEDRGCPKNPARLPPTRGVEHPTWPRAIATRN